MSVDTEISTDTLAPVGRLVHDLDQALRDAAVTKSLGDGLTSEFRYAIVAFRSRFPASMPSAQQDLFAQQTKEAHDTTK